MKKADRERIRALREKVRSGTATQGEREEFEELEVMSKYRPVDSRQHRLAADNATIRSFEQERQKDKYGSSDVVLSGQMESDKYSAQKAADEAYDWGEQYFMDNRGNTWVSDREGNYTTVDKNGVHRTESADNIAEMV